MYRFASVLLLVLGLAAFSSAQAQTAFGLKAGLNMADISGIEEEEGVDQSPRLGLVAGVFAEVPFSPSLSFRPELLYSQKGAQQSASFEVEAARGGGIDFESKINLAYLELPLLAHYMIPAGTSGLELGILAGLAPAFKLTESVSLTVDGEEVDVEDEEDTVSSFDLGLPIAVMIGSGPFAVDLRYTMGLLDINDSEVGEGEDELDAIRNSVFSFTANYTFGR